MSRLVLQPLAPAHAAPLRAWLAEADIRASFGLAVPPATRLIAAELTRRGTGPAWQFVLVADGVPVGFCGLRPTGVPGVAELGYAVAAAHRRRGYAAAGAAWVVAHGFAALGLDAIQATVPTANPASGRVLARLGFHLVSELPVEPAAGPGAGPARLQVLALTRAAWKGALGGS